MYRACISKNYVYRYPFDASHVTSFEKLALLPEFAPKVFARLEMVICSITLEPETGATVFGGV